MKQKTFMYFDKWLINLVMQYMWFFLKIQQCRTIQLCVYVCEYIYMYVWQIASQITSENNIIRVADGCQNGHRTSHTEYISA